jgi:hypothetical protein
MNMEFQPIDIEKQPEYLKCLSESPIITSDYSFLNLWGWAEEYGLRWAWSDNLVWIKQTIPEECNWAPVGKWEGISWNRQFDNHTHRSTPFTRIPEQLLDLWKDDINSTISIEEARGHWDYLYSVTDLIALKGNRFHKKKNLLNQFKKKYDYEYVPFTAEMVDMALAMQENWCTWRDCESSEGLAAENRVISRILNNWENLHSITGGAIIIDGEMVAYTIAEALTTDTLVIHFEKGHPDYRGVYQAINQMFLDNLSRKFKIVNREQDLGDEGLRKAKLSYNPIDFNKKYHVIFR